MTRQQSDLRAASTDSVPPFFGLLAEADEIQIRELHIGDRTTALAALEQVESSSILSSSRQETRSFIVQVRNERLQAGVEPSRDYDIAKLRRSAALLLEGGDYLLARNLYSYAVRRDAQDWDSLHGLGVCFLRLGEISSAKKCFRTLIDEAKNVQADVWLGFCYAAEQNDLAALDSFARFDSSADLEAKLRFELFKISGNSLTRLGRLKEAAQQYDRALEIDPNSDVLQVNYGTLCLQDFQHTSAREHFTKALSLNPRNGRAYCGLGLVSVAEGSNEDAEQSFLQALDLDVQNQVALLQLFSLLRQRGDYSAVTPYLKQYLVREPQNAEVHYALAEALFSTAAWKDCQRHIDACLNSQPGHAQATKLEMELKSVSSCS